MKVGVELGKDLEPVVEPVRESGPIRPGDDDGDA